MTSIFRYLVGIVGVSICYGQQGSIEGSFNMSKEAQGQMIRFVDVDFRGDLDTQCLTTRFIFSLNRGIVSWRSCQQPITTLSTTKVEYIGITKAAKEVLWLKDLVLEMGVLQDIVRVHYDSQSTLYLVQNMVYHAWTKHINIRFYQIKELVKEGKVQLVKVYTKQNPVDALMKTLSRDSFYKCVVMMDSMDRLDFAATLGYQDEDCRLRCCAPKSLMAKWKAKILAL